MHEFMQCLYIHRTLKLATLQVLADPSLFNFFSFGSIRHEIKDLKEANEGDKRCSLGVEAVTYCIKELKAFQNQAGVFGKILSNSFSEILKSTPVMLVIGYHHDYTIVLQ